MIFSEAWVCHFVKCTHTQHGLDFPGLLLFSFFKLFAAKVDASEIRRDLDIA